jgi:acetoin:2,6-dichlorophenolindophenol oxidoreductase subunit alpha
MAALAQQRARLEQLYKTMALIRAFEQAAEQASQGGVQAFGQTAGTTAKVRGPLHLSIGQEACPTGVCAHLNKTDLLTSTHRGHGHTIAKGADINAMMAELFGKATGSNGGKGGSMHIADFSVGMLGANGVVAAGLPIAAGAAHAQKLLGRNQITVCFFGDGAINRGPFMEAMNWARIYNLPVLFVCEDNQWSATTKSDLMTAGEGASARAQSLGITGQKVDGNDVLAVDAASKDLIAKVRLGQGPQLLHALTYRVKGHVSVDPATYRDPAELQKALLRDPLVVAQRHYEQIEGDVAVLHRLMDEATATIARAVSSADAAPWPEAQLAYTDVQSLGAGQWY